MKAALLALLALFSQPTLPSPFLSKWSALWISHPTAPLREPIVLHFRRTIQLPQTPPHFIVHVSADNRFIFYVNGQRVGDGPARGTLANWRYETFDVAPFLATGTNTLAATVWNFGIYAPVAQITDRTAFLVQGNTNAEAAANTGPDWMVEVEQGHGPLPRARSAFNPYMAAGPGEQIDGGRYDWAWLTADLTSSQWVHAASAIRENPNPSGGRAHSPGVDAGDWCLVPDELPPMEYQPTDAGATVRADTQELRSFPAHPVSVEPHQHIHLLLDRKTLTTAYPELTVSGGRDARIRLTYAEALYDAHMQKADRDEVGNRLAFGIQDLFVPDGGAHRSFQPLWWRTWRYLDFEIETADQPLMLETLRAHFTAFPFEQRAKFQSADPQLAQIWDISWRTARLDAHETYMDTPYYEQLQYVGDTRIQALISYTVAGDDRLAKQAIAAFDESRIPVGITASRSPSNLEQIIPTFSLIYVMMLHDYWMYRPDVQPIESALPGTRSLLAWFARYQHPDGLLGKLPWWSFVDWVPKDRLPSYNAAGESCTTTLQYVGALKDAAELEAALGDKALADRYRTQSDRTSRAIYDICWDSARGLLADDPDRITFSQQTNSLGVLYDVVPPADQKNVLAAMLNIQPGTFTADMLSSSYYFRFYLARALEHAGLGDEYLGSLAPWRDLLPLHFSTWPEVPGDTRSDSHAWSAHPIFDLLTIVGGIAPASPGFKTVRIAPHPGTLQHIDVTYPHPAGDLTFSLQQSGSQLIGTVTLPPGLTGTFEWHGTSVPLASGKNVIATK